MSDETTQRSAADVAKGGLTWSDSLEKIAPAFVAVQKNVKDPPRSGRNPHFDSSYVTLEDLIHAVRPVLAEHGITLMQAPGMEDGQVTVETLLLHESGEWVRSTARSPMQKGDPQGVGSAVTYLRRYSLASMLGIAHEADDDANRASRPSRSRPSEKQNGAGESGHACPDCGSDIWNNLDDPKAAANGGKRPNFKCKDKDCDWASWDSEDEVFGSEEGYEWADPLEDFPELQSAVRELESLNEERGANARTWLEGITGELSEDPQAVQDALERLERGISEERDGGTDDSGAEPADPASEDEGPDKSEWADRAEVLTWLHDEYGDEWEGKLNFFLATHPEISVEGQHENLDKMGWNRIKRFIDEHGREGIEDPRSYVQGQLEGV